MLAGAPVRRGLDEVQPLLLPYPQLARVRLVTTSLWMSENRQTSMVVGVRRVDELGTQRSLIT